MDQQKMLAELLKELRERLENEVADYNELTIRWNDEGMLSAKTSGKVSKWEMLGVMETIKAEIIQALEKEND